MKRYSTLKSKNIQEKEEKFLQHLKSQAIEINGEYFLPNVSTINSSLNPSATILRSLKREARIIPLGKRHEIDFELIRKIQEKLNKEPEKKGKWFWRQFFINPARDREWVGAKYFKNTSVLYKIKP